MINAEEKEDSRWSGVREVMNMSWPIVLGSLSFTIMEFTDKWMVSKLGTVPLAAVGSSSLWSYTLSTIILGIVGCVSTFAAQSLGRGEKENCARYAWQGLYLGLFAGLLALALWPVAAALFRSMGHSSEATGLEIGFFKIRLLGYLPMAWGTALAAFFQAINRPRVPMYAAIAGTALNALLNYLLIFGIWGFPQLGVNGSATATVFSQYFQAVLLHLVFIYAPSLKELGTRRAFRFDLARFKELVRVGLPSGAGMFLDIFNWGIFTSYVVGHFGDVSLAAHNIAISFMHISFMPAVAVNQGIAAIVGQWIGKGNVPRAKSRTYTAIKICVFYMAGMGLIFGVFGESLIRNIFSADPGVVDLGHKLLVLAAFFQAFDAINITCIGALRGAGDTRWMMIAMFIGAYTFFLPLAYTLSFPLGGAAYGAWIGATIYICAVSGVLFWRFWSERWRHINIFSEHGK